MKTKTTLINAMVITAAISITAVTASAHSNHDHSMVPYKWELSKKMKAKMMNKLEKGNSTLVGLTPLEQKEMELYNISVGNKFNTTIRGINFLMERTSAGMKILNAMHAKNAPVMNTVPIRQTRGISKVSLSTPSHVGHAHGHLPYVWTFNMKTQEKIKRSMVENRENVLVGLNKVEQSLMTEYEIKTGNTFQTIIAGHKFLVEKTTAGIRIINHVKVQEVASANTDNSSM